MPGGIVDQRLQKVLGTQLECAHVSGRRATGASGLSGRAASSHRPWPPDRNSVGGEGPRAPRALNHIYIVSWQAAEIVMAEQTGPTHATASCPVLGLPQLAAAGLISGMKRRRTGFMAAYMAHADQRSSATLPCSSEDVVLEYSGREMELFESTP